MSDMKKYIEIIKKYSKDAYKWITREPKGTLNHPFIVPGKPYPYQLWDWDSWLTDVATRQIIVDNGGEGLEEYTKYEKGCIINFLEHTDENGKMPILVDGEGEVIFLKDCKNMHKPCLAQHLAFILQVTDNDVSWLSADHVAALERFMARYKREYRHAETGLYRFLDDTAIGFDNDPSIF